MKVRRIFRGLCEGILFGSIVLFAGTKVVHGEIIANPFSFSFDGVSGNIYDYSRPEWKDDYSSSWVNYMYGDTPMQMSIVAYNSGYVEDIPMQKKIFYPGDNNYIHNWVRENGYYRAALRGEATRDSYYTGSGVWSADSVDY